MDAYILQSKVNRGNRGGPNSPWIEYKYVVNGRTYTSDRLDFGEWSYDDVPAYLRGFPVGSVVTAFYDPANPELAVLKKSGALVANLFFSLLAWGAGATTVYYRFFKRVKL